MPSKGKDLQHYLGLSYPIELRRHPEHGGYFASHPDLEGCMAEGATAEEAVAHLDDSRELWIEARLERGYPVPEPLDEELSGRLSLRMTPSLHAQLAKLAVRKGVSLNLLINTILAQHVGGVTYEADLGKLLEKLRAAARALSSTSPSPGPKRSARGAPLSSGPPRC